MGPQPQDCALGDGDTSPNNALYRPPASKIRDALRCGNKAAAAPVRLPIAIAHAVLHLTNLFYFQSAGSRKTWLPPALRRRQQHVSRQRATALARSTQQKSS